MKAILRSVFLALAIMALAVPVNAGPFKDGLAAYDRGDYAAALNFWRPLAEQGVAEAQFYLGILYENGQGVPQDHAEAPKWWRKAAEQGHVTSQWVLGFSYELGEGVPQDYTEAAKWFRKAAEQGDAGAQNSLGVMYANGEGVLQNFVQAHMWFTLAAGQGYEQAFKNRDFFASQMTADQITEAQRMAREWMAKHKR
jgi:TPR repeat protein